MLAVCPAYLVHRRDEAIAAPRHSLNKLWSVGALAERFSQQRNVLRQIAFFDEGLGPDFLHQIVFGNGPAIVFQQRNQYVECFGREWNELLLTQEHSLVRLQAESPKLVKISHLLAHEPV